MNAPRGWDNTTRQSAMRRHPSRFSLDEVNPAWTEVEDWRPVVGAEGFYEVSNIGNVRTVPRILMRRNGRPQTVRARIRSQYNSTFGYKETRVGTSGTGIRTVRVHVLVAEAFIGPRPEGSECRHLNGNPADNRVSNLAWGTRSENNRDAVAHGTHWQTQKTHCPQNHEYTPENTNFYIRRPRPEHGSLEPMTDRRCKTCARLRSGRRLA